MKDELISAATFLGVAHGHLDWPASTELTCTDATPMRGGSVRCQVSRDLSKALFAMTETRGCYVRLDQGLSEFSDMYTSLVPTDPLASVIIKSIPWEVNRNEDYGCISQVNLQEMRAIRNEIIDACREGLTPFRRVNGTDSNVCLGAWAKGRSSSFLQLNGLMRKTIGWQVMANKTLANFRVDTKDNPADDPSRNAPLRKPESPPEWAEGLLVPESTPLPDAELVPWELRSVGEVYAGRAGLSLELHRHGLLVEAPLEAFPSKGVYIAWCDIKEPRTRLRLFQKIHSRTLKYLHFGITCTTWGNAGRLNGGTRRKGAPYGNGSLDREVEANAEMKFVVQLCLAAAEHGCYFTIENPADSYIFETREMSRLQEASNAISIKLDQCCYGLKFADSTSTQFCKKPTCILTNVKNLTKLERTCPGLSPNHEHVHAWGAMKAKDVPKGTPLKRAAAAGAYPPALCRTWAQLIQEQLSLGPHAVPKFVCPQTRSAERERQTSF